MKISNIVYICLLVVMAILILNLCNCNSRSKQPKLVVGLVIDQMRWDYLYRYNKLYGSKGFKRLLKDGYKCQNTMVNYIPSFTAPGHACIYTGSVPSIHGIAANNWIENETGATPYCTFDASAHLQGDKTNAPSMSPKNLLVTTITDEFRLASNFKSKVYGVAIKDRGSILPAGHLANAAYWYSDTQGIFTTSSYYMNQNPDWLIAFNKRNCHDSLIKLGWRLLKQPSEYDESTGDENLYEKGFKGEKTPVFPHLFDSFTGIERNTLIKSIPAGNTYTLLMAKECIKGEKLGKGKDADFLTVSLSSTDYAGHQFGPNSVEMEDMFLRLDNDIADFLSFLDKNVGKGNYLIFLTADHGAAHNATFLQERDVPAGVLIDTLAYCLNKYLLKEFNIKQEMKMNLITKKPEVKVDSIIRGILNYQVFLNDSFIVHTHLDREKVKSQIVTWLKKRHEISYVADMENMDKTPVPEPLRTKMVNGYNYKRSGVITFIPNPGWYENGGRTTGTTHGTWNPYDTHIPLIWYGWHINKGETFNEVNMTDITPTLAALLHIQMPNGCIGKPIKEVLKNN